MGDVLGRAGLRAGLASAQADLGEEGLAFLTARPFSGIENGRIPFEIIIGLTQPALLLGVDRPGYVSPLTVLPSFSMLRETAAQIWATGHIPMKKLPSPPS